MRVEMRKKFEIGEKVKIVSMHKEDSYFKDFNERFRNKIGIVKGSGGYTQKGYCAINILIDGIVWVFHAVKVEKIEEKKTVGKKGICHRCNEWHQRLFVVENYGKKELICRKCIAELIADYFVGKVKIERK